MSNRQKLLGNLKKGKLFILSAPAGTGKTTLAQMLCKEFDCVKVSISCTTRAPRDKEKDGEDYFFITKKAFMAKVKKGEFLEHVSLFDAQYGTSRIYVERLLKKGNHVILVIDTQGAMKLKKNNIPSIFLMPPSIQELERRLKERGTESNHSLSKRLQRAKQEIKLASSYEYVIINDDLSTAYEVLRSILIAEERKGKNDGIQRLSHK